MVGRFHKPPASRSRAGGARGAGGLNGRRPGRMIVKWPDEISMKCLGVLALGGRLEIRGDVLWLVHTDHPDGGWPMGASDPAPAIFETRGWLVYDSEFKARISAEGVKWFRLWAQHVLGTNEHSLPRLAIATTPKGDKHGR